jgi:CRISPR system Cascade subunit CasD
MCDYLIFRLYGPLAAWGDIAVGGYRPSFAHPSKSAIVGLLAAALGIRREDTERQKVLAEACSFAIRVDAMGTLLRDYHTTQVPQAKRGIAYCTRRSELAGNDVNTILSSRDYRCDAVYTVVIEIREGSAYTARELADALAKPVFTLYLGRKSCPLAWPLQPKAVTGDSVREALAGFILDHGELAGIINDSPALLYWEDGLESGLSHEQVITRRDAPLSRTRWQFGERHEHYCSVIKEDTECSSL